MFLFQRVHKRSEINCGLEVEEKIKLRFLGSILIADKTIVATLLSKHTWSDIRGR